MRLEQKQRLWKFLTALAVLLIIFNPELVELAVFIDIIGLDVFFMLIEIQLLAIVGAAMNQYIKPAFIKTRNLLSQQKLKFAPQAPAILMNALVFSSTIGFCHAF
jgi:hypothetical protein